MKTTALLSIFFLLVSLFSLAAADTLFEVDFTTQRAGEINVGQAIKDHDGVVNFWQGPKPGEFGRFAIKDAPEINGTQAEGKPVLIVYDNNAEKAKAPVVTIDLANPPSVTQTITVEIKFFVPPVNSFQGLIGFGKGSWAAAAAVFTLTDGKISSWQPGDAYTPVGTYDVTGWTTLRVTFDSSKKVFDVKVNDQTTATDIPWAHKNSSLATFEAVADLAPRDRNGEPVFYIESIKIISE